MHIALIMRVLIKPSLCTWQIIETQQKLFSRKHEPFQIFTPTLPSTEAFTSHNTHEIIFIGIQISYVCQVRVRPLLTFHRASEIVTQVSYYTRRDLPGFPLLGLLPGQHITLVRVLQDSHFWVYLPRYQGSRDSGILPNHYTDSTIFLAQNI